MTVSSLYGRGWDVTEVLLAKRPLRPALNIQEGLDCVVLRIYGICLLCINLDDGQARTNKACSGTNKRCQENFLPFTKILRLRYADTEKYMGEIRCLEKSILFVLDNTFLNSTSYGPDKKRNVLVLLVNEIKNCKFVIHVVRISVTYYLMFWWIWYYFLNVYILFK